MLTSPAMRPVPLTALDYVMLAAERRARRDGVPGIQGQVHVNFRGRIEMSQLQDAADRLAARWPLITARLVRSPRPAWVPTGAQRWQVRQQTVDSDSDADLLRAIFQLAAEPVDLENEDPVRLIVLHRPGGDDVLTMNLTHVLLDGHGATGLLRQLLDPTRIPPSSDTVTAAVDVVAQILARSPFRDRMRGVRRMLRMSRQVQPVTLPLLEKRQPTTHARITLRWIDETGSAAIRDRLERLGPYANLLFSVLASGCRTLSRHLRGPLGPRSGYRMVLHYDLRRGSQKQLIFQNLAGRIVLVARPADLGDKDGLIRLFASQAKTQIAEKTSLAVLQVAEILRAIDRWAPWLAGIRPPQSSVHGSTWGDLAESGRTVFGATVDHSWFTVFFLPQFSNVNVALNLVKVGRRYRVIFMHSPHHLSDEQASQFLDEWLDDLCRP